MKWLKKIVLLLLLGFLVSIFSGKVLAQTPQEVQAIIDELTKKVAEVQGQARTLSGQISNFNYLSL